MRRGNAEAGSKNVRRADADRERERERQHHQGPVDEADVEGARNGPQRQDKRRIKSSALSLVAHVRVARALQLQVRRRIQEVVRRELHLGQPVDTCFDLAIGDQEKQVGEPSRDGDKKPERQPHVLLPVVSLSERTKRAKWRAVGGRNASCGIEKRGWLWFLPVAAR